MVELLQPDSIPVHSVVRVVHGACGSVVEKTLSRTLRFCLHHWVKLAIELRSFFLDVRRTTRGLPARSMSSEFEPEKVEPR